MLVSTKEELQLVADITEDQQVGVAVIGDSVKDTGIGFSLFYGYASCELADYGNCSEDGLIWRCNDMGSPDICTEHFFPIEQTGYEFVKMN